MTDVLATRSGSAERQKDGGLRLAGKTMRQIRVHGEQATGAELELAILDPEPDLAFQSLDEDRDVGSVLADMSAGLDRKEHDVETRL